MRRHAPGIVAVAVIVAVIAAALGFAFSARPARPPIRSASAASAPASGLTSSFALVDPQPTVALTRTISAAKTLYDRPQRSAATVTRLRSHDATPDSEPPAYLVAQGVSRVRSAGMRVALTFDDGPSTDTTAIVEILKEKRVHATFFVVGRRVQTAPHLARLILSQGSELGNHTYSHVELWHQSIEQDERQIADADRAIFDATGVRPVFVRPRAGHLDDNGMAAIHALRKTFVYWDSAGYDTVPEFTAAEIRETVLDDTRPGSVILLHETNPRTVAALPGIIDGLRRKGYTVESVSELLAH